MENMKVVVLGGYLKLITVWGSDEGIVETARMSTGKGFLGWGPKCILCEAVALNGEYPRSACPAGAASDSLHTMVPGDEKLLKHLWDNRHSTPFEFAGMTVEVEAPLFVFREWHRHRTQAYSEVSARYTPLPNSNYVPSVERILMANTQTQNRQAQGSGRTLTEEDAVQWQGRLEASYAEAQAVYEEGIKLGVAKEVARAPVPVGRYSRMRATANLRNWAHFLGLRCDPHAQWEIRQYANALADLVKKNFPRTYEVAAPSLGLR